MSDEKDYWLPRSGPMPRPESLEQARELLGRESFENPMQGDGFITFETSEFTSFCPRSGQPDFGTVVIAYEPDKRCIESKSLKFYLWAWRDEGGFCEDIAERIAQDIVEAVNPHTVIVEIQQNIRGGIHLNAEVRKGKSLE